EVIDRTCSLQSLANDQAVRDVVGKVGALPSIPRTYWELTAALARPSIGLGALGEIVARDPPMSARVLQIVNSAYFGLERRITSIREAVTFLGVDALKGLALSSHVFSSANAPTPVAAALERLQRSSMAVARLAKGFVTDPDRSEETFSAAIVHDVGKIVLTMSMSETYRAVTAEVARSRRPAHVVEREMLGVTHPAVGAYLLGVWGLPIPIVEAVAYHHEPSRAPEEVQEIVAAVHVADALVDAVMDGPGSDAELDLPFLASIGWTERLPRFRALAAVELKWLRAMGG
ncbi:MAG: HDOD domain-containing protein, partial [Myxococcales bacterium]|nr:HDOD domain-containing protein [Myxococcales bacterium]